MTRAGLPGGSVEMVAEAEPHDAVAVQREREQVLLALRAARDRFSLFERLFEIVRGEAAHLMQFDMFVVVCTQQMVGKVGTARALRTEGPAGVVLRSLSA